MGCSFATVTCTGGAMGDEGTLYFMITVDIDPEVEDAFNHWYDTKHMPETCACPGFVRGWRFRAEHDGEHPRYCAIYEVEHDRVLETPELNAIRGFAQFTERVRNLERHWFRTIFVHDPGA
ncbi:MAG: hypothetical protein FJW96_00975 [Actinobacteria bacterium]|nr:hypothetical protein [Actinomycetota bacterium]